MVLPSTNIHEINIDQILLGAALDSVSIVPICIAFFCANLSPMFAHKFTFYMGAEYLNFKICQKWLLQRTCLSQSMLMILLTRLN